MYDIKIDALVCWVDGNDPAMREKRMKYISPEQASRADLGGDTRYASLGEIRFCIASILRNAPFINSIFIVTDNQIPPLEEMLKKNFPHNEIPIKIVDHKILFAGYEDCLPTFNSGALETMMWRIPELSDWFIYMNDDFAFTAPVTLEDFYRDGRPVVHGYWHSRLTASIGKFFKGKKKLHFRDGMLLSAKAIGAHRFVRIPHIPRLFHKQTQEAFYSEHPDLFRKNMSFRFRAPGRLDNNSLIATLLAMNENAIVEYDKDDVLYLEPRKDEKRFEEEFARCKRLTKAKFFCVNSLDQFPEEKREEILSWLCERIGIEV